MKHSKRRKKDWRRHSDVRDVEEFLESRRRDDRLGVSAAEKKDGDLFYVQNDAEDPKVPVRLRRSEIRKRPLTSELNLPSNSHIKRFQSQGKKTISSISVQPVDSSSDEEFSKSSSYRGIKRDSIRSILAHKDEVADKRSPYPLTAADPWQEEQLHYKVEDEHYLKVTKQINVKRPKTLSEVPTSLRSVELPHPGMSYNPSFKDHQDLLRTAVVVEEKKKKAEEKLQKQLKVPSMSHIEREKVWEEEMGEGIGDISVAEVRVRSEEEIEDGCARKRPVRAEDRKTRKQRRKEMLKKKEEWMRKQLKSKKKQMDEVYRLRSIKKGIVKEETDTAEKKARLQALQKQALYGTKRLGRLKYVEPDIPLKLSSELTGSLRTLKTEGSMAMDRYKSLQKRNIVEPRKLVVPHRKYRLLVKEKRSTQMDW